MVIHQTSNRNSTTSGSAKSVVGSTSFGFGHLTLDVGLLASGSSLPALARLFLALPAPAHLLLGRAFALVRVLLAFVRFLLALIGDPVPLISSLLPLDSSPLPSSHLVHPP
jgi:hypothetical protein